MMKYELISQTDPKSPVSEIFKNLRTNIQFMNSNKELKTILLTSTVSGEGKTWISSNLAITFAQAGKRVLLIDSDMRKPRIHDIFGLPQKPGLSNYLSGINEEYNAENNFDNLVDYIKETEIHNLSIITSGNIPPNPSELLIRPQMLELLEKLKKYYDVIIIDGTPSKLVTDSIILSRIVDCTLIVSSHNLTKKTDLEEVVKNIQNVGGKIAGVIYNRVQQTSKEYHNKYYYSDSNSENRRNKRN